ncbi:MAG: hypothetical protein U1E65_30475 [Myxococcota bacterium]
MGLAERRAAKAFQDNKFSAIQKALEDVIGFPVKVEVDWDSISTADYGHLYESAWTKVYFEPLIAAMRSITSDDLGRDALKASLKKITIRDEGSSWPTYEGGVLALKYLAVSNLDDVDERARTIRELMEKAL